MKPIAVLIHVPDVRAGLAWYMKAFPLFRLTKTENEDVAVLDMDGFNLEIVRADAKVSNGKNGSVLYWLVPSVEDELARLVSIGGKLYRGPMKIENGLSMCQVEDPFENLIGLRGKR